MKKLLILLCLIVISVPFLYGQASITMSQFTEAVTVNPTDIFWLVIPGKPDLSRKIQASNLLKHNRSCEVVFGNADPAATVLTDNADQPRSCRNVSGADQVITAVACNADAAATVTPVLTGGGTITGQFTCGTGANWAAGSIVGTPTLHSFAANGATCSVAPCTLDANLQAANGAKYVIIGFTISSQ